MKNVIDLKNVEKGKSGKEFTSVDTSVGRTRRNRRIVRRGWKGGDDPILLAPSLSAIVTTRGNIGKSIWLPLPSFTLSLVPPVWVYFCLDSSPSSSDFSFGPRSSDAGILLLSHSRPHSDGWTHYKGVLLRANPQPSEAERKVQEGRMCVARAAGWDGEDAKIHLARIRGVREKKKWFELKSWKNADAIEWKSWTT